MLNSSQIRLNLRRTADKGLISLLHQSQLEQLALKYFGVKDVDGNYMAYQCPYSGKTITDYKDLILEHIIPVASNGGTVLFNCIPASKEVNGSDEKGAKHLIEWWTNSDYWDNNALQRLEKLVNYMLEASNQVFEEYTIEELEESYLDIINYSDSEIDEDNNSDLSYSINEYKAEIEQAQNNKIYSYLGFLNDCIEQLKKENINVDQINNKLKKLQEKKIFENIEQYTKVQNITKEIITKILGDDNRSYLTYSLNIDINKLMKSIAFTDEKEIYNEIASRLININTILIENGLSIIDFFKNLIDIDEINILYRNINEISQEQINEFIESISLGYDSKKVIFLEMFRHAQTDEEITELLKRKSSIPFTTYIKDDNNNYIVDKVYKNSPIGQFWSKNIDKLKPIIESNKELRDKLDNYYFNTRSGQISVEGNKRRINAFIEMLRCTKGGEEITELLKADSTIPFTTYIKDENNKYIVDKVYEKSPIGSFWSLNKEKLKPIIESDKELRDKLDDYYFNTRSGKQSDAGNERRINVFIEMLRCTKDGEEISKLLKQESQIPFTTYIKDDNNNYIVDKVYENSPIGQFWSKNIDKLKPIIESNKELRDKLDDYYFNTLSGMTSVEGNKRRQKVFLEMLRHMQTTEEITELLKSGSTIPFTTYIKDDNNNYIVDRVYKNSPIGQFWPNNIYELKPIIESDKELRDKLDDYYFNTRSGKQSVEGNERRINVFIEMLRCTKDGEEISKLLKQESQIPFTTYIKDDNNNYIVDKVYENSPIGQFWSKNKEKLKPIIESDRELRDKLDDYYFNTRSGQINEEGIERRQEVFIEMLRHAQTAEEIAELLKKGSPVPFTTYTKDDNNNYMVDKVYEKSPIGQFWRGKNKEKLKPIIESDRELRDKLDNYYFNTRSGQISEEGKERRQGVFIEMIRNAQTAEEIAELLKYKSQVPFTTYIKDDNNNYIVDKVYKKSLIGKYWHNSINRKKILDKLKENLMKNETIIQKICNYYKVNSFEEYLETETKKEELRQLKNLKKQTEELNNQIINDEEYMRKVN